MLSHLPFVTTTLFLLLPPKGMASFFIHICSCFFSYSLQKPLQPVFISATLLKLHLMASTVTFTFQNQGSLFIACSCGSPSDFNALDQMLCFQRASSILPLVTPLCWSSLSLYYSFLPYFHLLKTLEIGRFFLLAMLIPKVISYICTYPKLSILC